MLTLRKIHSWLSYRRPERLGSQAISSGADGTAPDITPDRVRHRLLAAFLTGTLLLLFLLPVIQPADLALPVPNDWLRHLNLYYMRSAGSIYALLLTIAVAILGIAQILRPKQIELPRRIWLAGWFSVAGTALFTAFIDFSELLDIGSIVLGMTLPAAWLAVIAPVTTLLLAPGAYILCVSQRGHPARAILMALALMLAMGSIVRDILTPFYLGGSWHHDYLANYLEESWELLAVAIVAVILLEMLTAKHNSSARVANYEGLRIGRRWIWAVSTMTGGSLLVLAIYATNLDVERLDMVFEGKVFGSGLPHFYTGPISLVEQEFQVDQDNLSRIKVWSYVDGGTEGEAAEIVARLTPVGSDHPIRESRARVRGARFSNTSVDFAFAPIPESGGKLYTLAIGVLSNSRPWVFLGLTDGDPNLEGAAVVNGEPQQHGSALAMTTYWTGRAFLTHMGGADADPRRIVFAVDLAVTTFLWVFAILVTERGLSACHRNSWLRFLGHTLWKSLIVTSGIATIGMLMLPMLLAGRPHV